MPDSRAIDQESRRIIRSELFTNILVEAAAGSGKTHMMAERMAAGVASGVYHVEQMAAVTFTRKAAAELRGRFHLALERELAKDRAASVSSHRSVSEREQRIVSALSNLERFFAGTIHSFCARLLRERPVESGVSPGFTELDEIQDFELRQQVWRDFVANARADGDLDMLALIDADVAPRDLASAFGIMSSNDDVVFPPGEVECPDSRPARLALESFWAELRRHLPPSIAFDSTCNIQKACRQFHRQLGTVRSRLDRPSVVASLLETWDRESKIVQQCWANSAAEKKRLRDVVQDLHATFRTTVVEPYLTRWRQYVYGVAVKLLNRARLAASEERRRINSLNYGDLLILAARVLRENRAVRNALQQKFRYILVDEFQDTDPVQAEIVFWLAEDGEAKTSDGSFTADWRSIPLRPGALFVVGDPKQSIYRFRRADIEIYNIVRERFSDPAVGRVVPLTVNFRSVPELCTWANDVFQTRFPSEATAHAPQFAALDASSTEIEGGGVFTLTHNSKGTQLQQEDGASIAAYIRSEVDSGRRRFSDFLILTRKKKHRLAPYAQALESLNIPVEVSGAGAFGDSAEVHTLSALLRTISNPQDSLSLLATLRGPLFGISDRDLFKFKQAGGWFSLFHELTEQPRSPSSSPVNAALSALRQYHRWARLLPAAAALDRILENTGYLALASTSPGGVDAGDLLHAVDRIRQVSEQGGSLAEAADALEADAEASSEVESLPLEPGRGNVVRLMNLHKAKGLEADVVFLADPAGGFTPRVDVHIQRTGLEAYGWLKLLRNNEGSFVVKLLGQPADWPAHEAAELPYLQAEEDRLLYVAATRARQQIVVSRSSALRTSAWGILDDFLGASRELIVPSTQKVFIDQPLDCTTASQLTSAEGRAAAHAQARKPSWAVSSATQEARHIARIVRSAEFSADDPSRVVSTDSPAHRADAGRTWGTLIHGLLEHAMRHNASADDLKRLGMWLTVEEPQLRDVLDFAVETVVDVASAKFWGQAKNSQHSAETPFAFAEGRNSIVTGVIDLLFSGETHWQIVDYKTDLDATNATAAYEQQLNVYKRALFSVGAQDATTTIQIVRKRHA